MTLEELFKILVTSALGVFGYFYRDVRGIAYDALDRAKKLETMIEYHEKQIEENNKTHNELREVLHSLDKTCVRLTEAMEQIKEDLTK
ncbi:hypothetical protein [Leptospira santarosai]|uniref:hypothetical protein n=1 Tax=Leptospira santarosai TaxID=28183 RepID=UPI000297C5CF|nr:hypothetical protein [Leptospira santarosai]EKR89682.1 hypothetical protein LEP1GSC163_0138 [Leptospira santarosai str. CBC379]MDI7165962.1 hypothetical protein [Leptospira santarosai]MDO6383410.1 hypothetical protein [Leptospira santarosai]